MSQKGSNFEREICKKLSLWWTKDTAPRDDIFWRTQTSGARATTRSKQGKETFGQYGDVQAVDPIGQPLMDILTIELKRGYSRSSFADMVEVSPTAAVQEFDKFVAQALTDARKANVSYWLLITKRDRKEVWLTMPRTLYRILRKMQPSLQTELPIVRMQYLCRANDSKIRIKIVMMPLIKFLYHVSPTNIKAIGKP